MLDSPGGRARYLTDRLGTIRDLAGQTGAVIDHLEYDSFGNVLSETNPSAGDRFKFTGREYDAETGLYYYRWASNRYIHKWGRRLKVGHVTVTDHAWPFARYSR